jgi:hypothetical protein
MIAQNIQTKVAVTVAEMARMVRLSRARFYQLQNAGVFPSPVYDVSTRRPYYDEPAQEVCLEVRRRNCGINGRAVLFYSRRGGEQSVAKKRKTANKPKSNKQYAIILDAVRSLGLVTVTTDQIGQAINELFPRGVDQSEVIRTVFVHIQRQYCSDNVG